MNQRIENTGSLSPGGKPIMRQFIEANVSEFARVPGNIVPMGDVAFEITIPNCNPHLNYSHIEACYRQGVVQGSIGLVNRIENQDVESVSAFILESNRFVLALYLVDTVDKAAFTLDQAFGADTDFVITLESY